MRLAGHWTTGRDCVRGPPPPVCASKLIGFLMVAFAFISHCKM